jgi:hypothetical protein
MVHVHFRAMRKAPEMINYVFFSGGEVVRGIKTYSVDGGEMRTNVWHGVSPEALDAVTPEGMRSSDRVHDGERTFVFNKPRFVSKDPNGSAR